MLDFDDRATINGQFFQNLRSHLVCIAIVFHVVKSSPMTKAELTSCFSSLCKELKTCLSPRFICCQVFTLVTVSAKSNCSRLIILSTCFVFRSSLSQSWRHYKEWTIDKYYAKGCLTHHWCFEREPYISTVERVMESVVFSSSYTGMLTLIDSINKSNFWVLPPYKRSIKLSLETKPFVSMKACAMTKRYGARQYPCHF